MLIAAVAVLLWLDPNVFHRYLEVNRTNSVGVTLRADNASPLAYAYRKLGWPGVGLLLGGFSLLWWKAQAYQDDWKFSMMLWGYFSVVLLPIAWIYSALPLLPVFVFFMSERLTWTVSLPVLMSTAILLLGPVWGTRSVPFICVALLLPGLSFLFYRPGSRTPQLEAP